MSHRKRSALLFFVTLFAIGFQSYDARAIDDFGFDTTSLANLTNQASEDLLKTVAFGADHRAYASASPLGLALGLDFGADITVISVPTSFKSALALVGNTTTVSDTLPLPKISLRKGLPWGVDLGFSYIGLQGHRIVGFDGQWNFFNQAGLAASGRVSYTNRDSWFIKSTTVAFDVLASKKLFIFDPYVGVGYLFGSGELEFPAGSVPVTVSTSPSFSNARIFIGLPIDLVFLKVVAEYNHNFADVSTYGIKANFSL